VHQPLASRAATGDKRTVQQTQIRQLPQQSPYLLPQRNFQGQRQDLFNNKSDEPREALCPVLQRIDVWRLCENHKNPTKAKFDSRRLEGRFIKI
jgi:hypothetical protein